MSLANVADAMAAVNVDDKKVEVEPEEDATGCDAGDIQLVMSNALVSRNEAIRALKKYNHDLVNTVINLTM